MTVNVPTYVDDKGHTDPQVPVEITTGQGITVKLTVTGSDNTIDVYIERREGRWEINVGDDVEIKKMVEVTDKMEFSVKEYD